MCKDQLSTRTERCIGVEVDKAGSLSILKCAWVQPVAVRSSRCGGSGQVEVPVIADWTLVVAVLSFDVSGLVRRGVQARSFPLNPAQLRTFDLFEQYTGLSRSVAFESPGRE